MILKFTVVVTDLGGGKLDAKLKAVPEDTIFNNSYEAKGEFDPDDAAAGLNPTKELTGRVLTDGAFTFQLKKGDALVEEVKNTADGNIPFSVIKYNQDELGEHDYTIHEVAGAEAGMTYDPMVLKFTVVVTDLGGGKLDATLKAVPSDTIFNNTYEATGEFDPDDAAAGLNPTKELTGRVLTDGAFTFQLKKGDALVEEVKNTADGNIPFSKITYDQTQLGEHHYTIHEVAGAEAGMTYDPMVLTFTVVVTDLGGGKLDATLKAVPEDTIFNNTYEATGNFDIDAEIGITKALAGRDLKADEFTFQLKMGDTILQTVKNAANGKVSFQKLAYTEKDVGKTFTYTVVEVKGDLENVTYDPMVLTFTVEIKDLGGGKLEAKLVKAPADTIFNNIYEEPTPEPKPEPLAPGSRLTNNLAECFE